MSFDVSERYFKSAAHAPPDVSGKRPQTYGPSGLRDVTAAFDDLLLLPDHGAVFTALGGIVANYADGDVVWPLLVGPPGSGKSEIVTALTSAPGVWSLSSLTPQTLLSGFERKGDVPASLLKQIGDFGILAFKDLTTVLTMHREARAQIIGQLREVADGKTEKSFGNGLRVEWEGKLGLIAGVTPIIDEQHSFLAIMGERFLLYRLPEVPRKDIARRSLARRGHEPELRERIRATVADFLSQFVDCGRLGLPADFNEPLIVLADIVTRARSGVPRDFNSNLQYMPEPEAPTRLAKQLAQLAAALLVIGVDERETWRLVRKAGWDSVPAVRCAVIDCLSRHDEPVTLAQIQEETELPERTAARVAEDIVVLKLARRFKDGGRWHFEQSPIAHEYWTPSACQKRRRGCSRSRSPHRQVRQARTHHKTSRPRTSTRSSVSLTSHALSSGGSCEWSRNGRRPPHPPGCSPKPQSSARARPGAARDRRRVPRLPGRRHSWIQPAHDSRRGLPRIRRGAHLRRQPRSPSWVRRAGGGGRACHSVHFTSPAQGRILGVSQRSIQEAEMASSWIEKRSTGGGVRYRVRFRLGGAESVPKLGGTFRTLREARARRDWVLGELAAMRVPDTDALAADTPSPTLAGVAEQWRASRVDVADGTAATHKVNLARIIPRLGTRTIYSVEPADVATLVSELHAAGLKRESIRKTIATLAMVFDFGGRKGDANPARDDSVKLPREDKAELNPPTAEHVLAVHRILAPAYRLPLLVLDATGMRVGELEALTWGDVDEPRGRWRVSQAVAKTGRARWVQVPEELFEAVTDLVAREDRTPGRPVFQGVTADRLRTALARACTAAGVPAFSPHDLRHRRISLLHLRGVPWARIGEHVGQRNLAVTANTYTHVLADESELDYAALMA